MKFILIFFFLLITSSTAIMAQDLFGYRWENRILLLITDETNNEAVDKQISEFRESAKKLEDRRLLVFLVTKDRTFMGLAFDESINNDTLYKKYKVSRNPFEMVLIGLDGGVKERYTEYQALENILALIDGMPMRREELSRKKEK